MGDYVLESNPALERLIERLGAEGKRPAPEESPRFRDSKYFQRRGRLKMPAQTRENPTAVDVRTRAELTSFVEADEVLDVYGRADLDEFGDCVYNDADASDDMDVPLEDQEGDGASVQTLSDVEDATDDWIFDAFKAWMLEADKAIA